MPPVSFTPNIQPILLWILLLGSIVCNERYLRVNIASLISKCHLPGLQDSSLERCPAVRGEGVG
jgi:hypothetical protein